MDLLFSDKYFSLSLFVKPLILERAADLSENVQVYPEWRELRIENGELKNCKIGRIGGEVGGKLAKLAEFGRI
ncbi:MAG: hypothetical protein Q8M98_06580 [Candidatus Cloacimonadaceae bacterium]|nr:hypothetical protein [Candidatus Cloacimonadaceae bacterium]